MSYSETTPIIAPTRLLSSTQSSLVWCWAQSWSCTYNIYMYMQRRWQQFRVGGGGARYVRTCITQFSIKRWGYYYSTFLHAYVYSTSTFRNASSACSNSNTHSVIIAPMGGGGGGKVHSTGILEAPPAPLCRHP